MTNGEIFLSSAVARAEFWIKMGEQSSWLCLLSVIAMCPSIRSRCNWHVLDEDTEMNFLFLRHSLRHVQRESELNYIPIDSSGSGRAEIIDDET